MTQENPATESALTKPEGAAIEQGSDPGNAIAAFASIANFEGAMRMAKALASSTLVPKAYQGNIPNTLIAMELASRTGASVFMVMQSLDVIHGNPSWRGKFLIALTNASGKFSPLRFEWRGEQGKADWGCRAIAKDIKSGEVLIGPWVDWNMVKAEGWLNKDGSKWKTMPELMFMYRSGAFWSRVFHPEGGLGMQTTEEVIDTTATALSSVLDMPAALEPGSPKSLESMLRSQAPAAEQTPLPVNVAQASAQSAHVNGKGKKAPVTDADGVVEPREPGCEG